MKTAFVLEGNTHERAKGKPSYLRLPPGVYPVEAAETGSDGVFWVIVRNQGWRLRLWITRHNHEAEFLSAIEELARIKSE